MVEKYLSFFKTLCFALVFDSFARHIILSLEILSLQIYEAQCIITGTNYEIKIHTFKL